jgi:hypothetical protein
MVAELEGEPVDAVEQLPSLRQPLLEGRREVSHPKIPTAFASPQAWPAVRPLPSAYSIGPGQLLQSGSASPSESRLLQNGASSPRPRWPLCGSSASPRWRCFSERESNSLRQRGFSGAKPASPGRRSFSGTDRALQAGEAPPRECWLLQRGSRFSGAEKLLQDGAASTARSQLRHGGEEPSAGRAVAGMCAVIASTVWLWPHRGESHDPEK